MERNRTELQKLTERLIDAESDLKASEDALYKAQTEWNLLQARLNALECATSENIVIQVENMTSPASNIEKSNSVQNAAGSEIIQEISQ